MPGCDPAGTTPPHAAPSRTVVPLLRERRRRREDPTNHTPHPAPDSAPLQTPEAILAETAQALYLHRGRTLTDPETAEAHDIALELVLAMVDAEFVGGHMGHETHGRLRHMLAAARRVPQAL